MAILGVGIRGFPIARYEDCSDEFMGRPSFRVLEEFDSAEAIDKYFQNLVSAPDSPLVGYLAYVIRKLGKRGV